MGWLLDRIVLKASRHSLPADGAERRWITMQDQRIECFTWQTKSNQPTSGEPDLIVIKFSGAAGRAENASPHPFDYWTDLTGRVSVANPPGYGNSQGRARLKLIVPWAVRTFETIAAENPGVPILLTGSSLGGAVAICVAASTQDSAAKGVLVRDVPQLTSVIWRRFGWKTGWLPARMTMQQVPQSLDAVSAANRCTLPAVFVSATRDRVVPSAAQQAVIRAYQGPKRVIRLATAGHYDPMSQAEVSAYRIALDWLRPQLL